MNQVMAGRAIAAVGVTCGLIALWTKLGGGGKYWDDDSLGILLLLIGIAAALCVLGAVATNRRAFDVAAGALGGAMLGFYLFTPALLAFDHLGQLDEGGWFGVCSALIVAGAALALWPSAVASGASATPLGLVAVLAGLVLVLVGIWTKVASGFGTYWHGGGQGHSLGILMLLLVVLTALALGAAYTGTAGTDSALVFASITAGLTLFFPVVAAFNNFGQLKVGAWLAGIGGLLLVLGVVAMRAAATAGAPSSMATPATPPPPAA